MIEQREYTISQEALYGPNGEVTECWCVNGNNWASCDAWSAEIYLEYVITGKYPEKKK